MTLNRNLAGYKYHNITNAEWIKASDSTLGDQGFESRVEVKDR